jgi:hypothetical protein
MTGPGKRLAARVAALADHYDTGARFIDDTETADLRRAAALLERYESALQRIADCDYRGNRSLESNIAHRALKEPP